MQRRLAVALLCLAGAFTAHVSARPPVQSPREDATYSDGDVGRRIVEFVQAMDYEGFSGAALAAKDGQVVAAVGVGSADLEGAQPMMPATLFEIASATKQFTAAAVMRLVQDQKLKLDDPIAEHLPGVPENCKAISIEHLLRHTSGIPRSNAQGGGEDIARVLPSFLHGGPRHEPGTHWEYWNQGYAILSEIISRAAGQSYVDYCRTALFEPAGLRSACFTGDAAPADCVVAIGRSSYGPPRSALEHPYGSYGFQYRGMGGAVCSVWDLWRWDRALHGDEILNEQTKAALFKPGLGDYALGWFVRRDAHGRLVQSHGGGVRGFICEMRRYPEQDAFIAVLCNRDDAPLHRVVGAVEAILFEQPLPGPTPLRPLDTGLAGALIGTYADDVGTSIVVETDGATIRARIHWAGPSGVVTRAVIGLDEQGNVALNDRSPNLVKLELERKADEPVQAISMHGRDFRHTSDKAVDRAELPAGRKQQRDALPIDPGMNVLIATAPYTFNKHGVTHLPPTACWRVLPKYAGMGEDGQPIVDDRITLIIQDAEHSFWPVIARMDTDVAEQLVRDLQAQIAARKAAE